MNKPRIMIVDDSPFSISIIRDILLNKGYEVVGEAGSLEETIAVTKATNPDLVTMDMTIPGTNGLECTHAIHEINSNIKVIIVSSMMDDEIIKKSKREKVAGYIQKPVDEEELITTIERALAGEAIYTELNEIYFSTFQEAFKDNVTRITKTVTNFENEDKNGQNINSNGISIVIGIIGKFSGRMLVDVSEQTALNLASAFYKKEVANIDLAISILGEFTNIVSGNACSMLNRKNKIYGFRVAPPTIFHGNQIKIANGPIDTTSCVAKTSFGEVYINVGFKRGEDQWM